MQGQAAGPGGRVARHQAHGCGQAHLPGHDSCTHMGLSYGCVLPRLGCVLPALQQAPVSSTQEATEPRARKKSRGPAQRPTQDRLFREWAEPVPSLGPGQGQTRGLLCSLGSGTSRAALGLEAQRTGRGDRWAAGWGPGCFAPNHTQSPACRLACRHPSHLLTSGALEPPRRVDAGGPKALL